MRFLCYIGVHPFKRKEATLKPRTFILRCPSCGLLKVKKRR